MFTEPLVHTFDAGDLGLISVYLTDACGGRLTVSVLAGAGLVHKATFDPGIPFERQKSKWQMTQMEQS